MGWTRNFFSSSIGLKFTMALSALFLMFFLLQHFAINFTSVFSEDVFNDISHFMGTNPLIQFALQPVLILAVVYHFVMGFVLEFQNLKAREVKYKKNKSSANASWFSRNMIWSGAVILIFLSLHFYDFWVPEMSTKYIKGDLTGLDQEGNYRYFEELVHKFHDPKRTTIYVLSFVFLAMHLFHGFQSAFQSVGANHKKYTPIIKTLSNIYAVCIPLGFIFIAIYHHFFNIT